MMRCSNCNKEWKIMEGDSQSVKCPYCGAIPQKGNITSITLNEAVKKIIDLYGVDILLSKGKFLSLFSDIAPKLVDEKNIISIALSENVASIIVDDSISKSERISIVQAKLSNILAKTAIDLFVESIVYALDWPKDIYVPLNDARGVNRQSVDTPLLHSTVSSVTHNAVKPATNSYQRQNNSASQNYVSQKTSTVSRNSSYPTTSSYTTNNSTANNSSNIGTQSNGNNYLYRLLPTMLIGVVVIVCVFIFVRGSSNPENTQVTDNNYSYTSRIENTESNVVSEEKYVSMTDSEEKKESAFEVESSEGDFEKENEYILPESDSAYISRSDLVGLSKEELKLARNEIFARHGRKFDDSGLQAYFNSCSWYHGTIAPSDFDPSVFNAYEKANVDTIVNYEVECGYR